jgi:transposase
MKSTQLPFEALREQAIALRRAGKSRRQIKETLGIGSNSTLDRALAGEPPPPWTRRPRAKDDVREKARVLREEGLDYEDIAVQLGVSKSSVSLWVRDMPRPARLSYEECRKRAAEGARRYWEVERPAREAGLLAISATAVAGVARNRLTYRLQIHENAQVQVAERFWLTITGAEHHQFLSPVLKRHNPKTVRKNSGDNYHGCLRIDVQRSSHLYRQIEGWAGAAMGVGPLGGPGRTEPTG